MSTQNGDGVDPEDFGEVADDAQMESMWEEEASKLIEGEAEDFEESETGPVGKEPPLVKEPKAEAEQQEAEGEEAEVEETPAERKLRELEERNAKMEEKLAAMEAAKTAPPPPAEEELPEDAKEMLDANPGLDKIVDMRARKIAREIFEEEKKARAAAETQQAVSAKETEFWGELNTWLKDEAPDLELESMRQSEDFTDWLSAHKTWADSQMAKAGRFETSGAKAVFGRYLREVVNPDSPRSTKDLAGTAKRKAAARTPSSLSTSSRRPAANLSEDELFDEMAEQYTETPTKIARRYV